MRIKAFFVVAALLMSASVFAQNFTEILGRPTNNSVTLSLRFESEQNVYCEYGTTNGAYNQQTEIMVTGKDNTLEIDMIGLLPNTRYYYRTRYKAPNAGSYLKGTEHTFITQRAKGSTFRFTIEADPHPYDKKGCWNLWEIALNNQSKDSADFMLDLGDTFGDDHEPFTITNKEIQALQLNCRDFFAAVCHSMPFYFCIGNHEGEFGYYLLQTPPNNLATYETLWRKLYFPNPYPNGFYTGCETSEEFGMGTPENYYAWEWGDALFVVLDFYRYATANEKPQKWDWTIGKEQYDWFKSTLENSAAKYKFVLGHHILGQGRGGVELIKNFEWGGMDGDKYKFDIYRPEWAMPLHQLMVENKVDIFFQGHDHIYVKQEADGIVYQTVPMPSDSTYKIGVTDNGDAFLSGTQLDGAGHLRVTVSPDSVVVDYVAALLPADETDTLKNGQVRYSYSIKDTASSNSTGLDKVNQQTNSWSVFPNPNAGELNISTNNKAYGSILIRICQLDGKMVYQKNFQYDGFINLKLTDNHGQNLTAGIYLLNIISGNQMVNKKVIIK